LREEVNKLQLFIGINILFLGVLFYYFFRGAEHTYFLKFLGTNQYYKEIGSGLFFRIGNSFPTFIHVFAFSLMTASLVASHKRGYVAVCLFWFTVNVIFELGQKFNSWVVQSIPDWFSEIFILDTTKNYFLHGHFDYLDLLSIALGALAAYIFLLKTKKGEQDER
jgi:hypothetical protein